MIPELMNITTGLIKRVFGFCYAQFKKHLPLFLVAYLSLILILLIFVGIIAWEDYQNTINTRAIVTQKYLYWENVVNNYPNYPDGYFKLAVFSEDLGNNQKAISAINTALRLDPMFKQAEKLKEELE